MSEEAMEKVETPVTDEKKEEKPKEDPVPQENAN